jgi:hypothetical protein
VKNARLPRRRKLLAWTAGANLIDRLQEAREQGWLGQVAAIATTPAATEQKLHAMQAVANQSSVVSLGMPGVRQSTGRSSPTG